MIVLMILVTIAALGAAVAVTYDYNNSTFRNIALTYVLFVVFALVFNLPLGCRVVAPGNAAIKVAFGKVDPDVLNNGFHIIAPWKSLKTYRVRLQEYTMSATSQEGNVQGNDSVPVLSKDNLQMNADVTIRYAVDPKMLPQIYQTLGNEYMYTNTLLRPTFREAVRSAFSKYNAMDALSDKRDNIRDTIKQEIETKVASYGIIIDAINLRDVVPPESITAAINAKITSQTQAEQMEFELQKTRKQAEIRVVEAEGMAKSQDIIQTKLTPLYVQHEAITMMGTLANSPNTTFVFVPTSPNGTGIPMILNAQNTNTPQANK